MRTYIFLAGFMVLCVHVADKMVDRQFAKAHTETGYSLNQVKALDRLIDKSLKEAQEHDRHKMTPTQRAEAMLYLYGGK